MVNEGLKAKYIELLRGTERENIDSLIGALVQNNFFTCPCSGAHHLCHEGGLLEHSLNVYYAAKGIAEGLEADIPEDSLTLCALLHDIGKVGAYGKSNYIPNYVRSKTKNKETGEYDMVLSEAKPYKTNPDLTYEEHEVRSLVMTERYIFVDEDEANAILHHNGVYGKLDSPYGTNSFEKKSLSLIIHWADMWCSRILEAEE